MVKKSWYAMLNSLRKIKNKHDKLKHKCYNDEVNELLIFLFKWRYEWYEIVLRRVRQEMST